MAKNLAKKQIGGPTIKTVTKSPSGNYKTIKKEYDDAKNKGTVTKVRRTIKGIINKAPTVDEANYHRSDSYKTKQAEKAKFNEGDYKKGGSIKTKTKK